MRAPTLVAVAHGSRDPAAQSAVSTLLAEVRTLAPQVSVQVAYLQLARPRLADILAATGPDAVVVPLLLARGYHVSVDVAAAAQRVGAASTAPLGPDPALAAALADRLAQVGAPPDVPVVLAAAGSHDPQAAVDVAAQAELLQQQRFAPVLPAAVAAGRPTVEQAVAQLMARTGRPVAVATYLLAPGDFYDRVRAAAATWIAAPLGAHPLLAEVVLRRYNSRLAVPVG